MTICDYAKELREEVQLIEDELVSIEKHEQLYEKWGALVEAAIANVEWEAGTAADDCWLRARDLDLPVDSLTFRLTPTVTFSWMGKWATLAGHHAHLIDFALDHKLKVDVSEAEDDLLTATLRVDMLEALIEGLG